MVNRKKDILVWLLIWSALLTVVLYSPIGSPEMYTPKKYYFQNQGVQFNGIGIVNSPTLKNVCANAIQETIVPATLSSELPNTGYYQVQAHSSASEYPLGNYPGSGNASTHTLRKAGISEGIPPVFWGIGRNSKDNIAHHPEHPSLMARMNSFSNNSTRQGSTFDLTSPGGTDPGDDPTSDPIPVGDSWKLMLICGLIYAKLKSRFWFTWKKPLK